jgi:hypothetical protein
MFSSEVSFPAIQSNNQTIHDKNHSVETPHRRTFRLYNPLRALSMQRFLYLRDPLFLVGCAAYAINR